MSPPLERVGGRGPSERTLLRVVVVVLAAALLAVVKPWGDGAGGGGGTAPRSALERPRPRSRRPRARPRSRRRSTRRRPSASSPSDWRLTSLEVFDRQTIRVWQTIEPGPGHRSDGPGPARWGWWSRPRSSRSAGAPRRPRTCGPAAPVTTRIWHVPSSGAPVELDLRPRLGPSDLGEDYPAPDVGAGTADWTPGRYVFAISEAAPGRSWWFAVTVRRFVPDGAAEAPTDAPASPVP